MKAFGPVQFKSEGIETWYWGEELHDEKHNEVKQILYIHTLVNM